MATGWTTTDALADSLPQLKFSARIVREFKGVMPQLVERKTLGKGMGDTWQEVDYAQLVAQSITQTTDLDNPQQISDNLLSITPTMVGIETFITDKVADRIFKEGYGLLGELAHNAVVRKQDEDGLAALDAATTPLCGAGVTLASGYISAATVRIRSNTTEGATSAIRCVLHGYQIHDLFNELIAGVGTYVVNEGPTADVFKHGFTLPVAGCEVFEDSNITIDSDADAKGGVFAKEALILLEEGSPRIEVKRQPQRGGGGSSVYHYHTYAYGERSAGNWLYEIYSDATAPTS